MSNPIPYYPPADKILVDVAQRCYEVTRSLLGQANQIVVPVDDWKGKPLTRESIEGADRILRRSASDPTLFAPYEPYVTSDRDASGDPQISYDRDVHDAAVLVATAHGAAVLGEEDQYRHLGAEAPVRRGEAIHDALAEGLPLVVIDPIDGSHQLAAMGQPGGYGTALMTVTPARCNPFGSPAITVGVVLGSGQMVFADGQRVWYRDFADPLESDTDYEMSPALRERSHYGTTWVLPAYKPHTMRDALAIIESAQGLDEEVAPKIIAPLGGNPGILSSLVLAPGGAVAAYQGKSWAWDQFVAYIVASLQWPVAQLDGRYLTASDLTRIFLDDLQNGRKTEPIVMGKQHAHTEALLGAVKQAQKRC